MKIEEKDRLDGFVNLLSGIGKKGRDKTTANSFEAPDYNQFNDQMLTDLYISEGLGAKIINRPADDMTRTWITVLNDSEGTIQEELKRLKAHNAVNKAIKWARLYRGAIIVIFFDGDSTDIEKPMPKNIRGIKSLRVYSAARIKITTSDIVDDFDSEYFDDVEVFPIVKKNGGEMRVHTSRCLIFKGETPPDYAHGLDFKYQYWGIPTIMRIWERLSNYSVVEKGVSTLMQEASIGKFTWLNLLNMLAQNNKEGLDQIYTRMEIVNASKSILNAVLLAEGESYTRDNLTFTGIPEVMDRMMMNLSAVADGIPVSILFGRSAAGMNATGDSDFRAYYDTISSAQDNWLFYILKKLVDIIGEYKKVKNPKIEFNPLEEANEKETAEIRKTNTESDKMDMEMGLYTAEEILERRGEIQVEAD